MYGLRIRTSDDTIAWGVLYDPQEQPVIVFTDNEDYKELLIDEGSFDTMVIDNEDIPKYSPESDYCAMFYEMVAECQSSESQFEYRFSEPPEDVRDCFTQCSLDGCITQCSENGVITQCDGGQGYGDKGSDGQCSDDHGSQEDFTERGQDPFHGCEQCLNCHVLPLEVKRIRHLRGGSCTNCIGLSLYLANGGRCTLSGGLRQC